MTTSRHTSGTNDRATTRWWQRATVGVLAGAFALTLAVTGCGSSADSTSAAQTTTTTAGPASPDTTSGSVADSEFCAAFAELAAGRDAAGNAVNADEAAWDRNIATVEHIASTAPDEISAQADAYVEMVKARKDLAAANGWADVADLPEDVRSAFISEHADLQQQVNQLLAFAKANCSGVS